MSVTYHNEVSTTGSTRVSWQSYLIKGSHHRGSARRSFSPFKLLFSFYLSSPTCQLAKKEMRMPDRRLKGSYPEKAEALFKYMPSWDSIFWATFTGPRCHLTSFKLQLSPVGLELAASVGKALDCCGAVHNIYVVGSRIPGAESILQDLK